MASASSTNKPNVPEQSPANDLVENVTSTRIRELNLKYPDLIADSLRELDTAREETIPKAVMSRSPPSLSKAELVTLMEWKLKHGKFRPTLRKLIASNDEAGVKSITRDAFELYPKIKTAKERQAVLTKLAQLKGVGPATSSLLLSVLDPDNAPFFADELFRYLHLSCDGKVLKGWDLKIKYDMKECLDLYERVESLRKRLNDGVPTAKHVSALQLEKAAYVLGKSGDSTSEPPPEASLKTKPGQKRALGTESEEEQRKGKAVRRKVQK